MIEKQLVYGFSILLIVMNLICLYFIISLLGCDEITAYLPNGGQESHNPRNLALLLLGTTVSNMLFVCVFLMEKLVDKYA